MLQPRHGKKWSRGEKWVLGACLPAMIGLSWWSLRQPDRLVDISPFKMRVASARFEKLAKPTILRPSIVAYARRVTRYKRLVPVQSVITLDHDGPRPSWWGHQKDVWMVMWYRASGGFPFDTMAGRTAIRFDRKSQQYILHHECMMPDDAAFQIDTCEFKGRIQYSPRYTNMSDPSAPTSLGQTFKFSTPMKFES